MKSCAENTALVPEIHSASSPASTSSDTLVSWSSQENEPVTMSSTESHNGIIRWYDPVTGRWMSKDPIGIAGGLNQYVFCDNNPVNFVDPLGLSGKLTIISSPGNNQYGSISFGNHALIVYQPDDTDITYTWGTWGRDDIGIVGLKENLENDRRYLDDACAKRRTKYIDDWQEMRLGEILGKYSKQGAGAWSKWSPCSAFAAEAWRAATGEKLKHRHLGGLGYSDPNILAESIQNANSGN